MNFLKTTIAAAAAMIAMAALPASANLITIAGGLGDVECDGAAAGACQGMTGGSLTIQNPGAPVVIGGTAGAWSDTAADVYDIGQSSEANEAEALNVLAALNAIAGTSFSTGTKTTGTGGDMTFTTMALYVALKIGNSYIFIQNTTGGLLEIAYDSFAGTGSGLSHYTEFGEVPIPAAIWLMGAGLAGLGFAGRRKKVA